MAGLLIRRQAEGTWILTGQQPNDDEMILTNRKRHVSASLIAPLFNLCLIYHTAAHLLTLTNVSSPVDMSSPSFSAPFPLLFYSGAVSGTADLVITTESLWLLAGWLTAAGA